MTLPLSYNWRNLFVRKVSTLLTFFVVTVVVFVLALLLSFAAGIRASLVATGSDANILVLKPGATAESTSIIRPEESARLVQTPGVARDAAGRLLISQELCVQSSIPRRDAQGSLANVAVRGVDDEAFDVHADVRIIEGRRFAAGVQEAIVGKAARDRFRELDLGKTLTLGRSGNREYKIVGIFEARGGALENEIWTPRTLLSDSYRRPFISSVFLRLTGPAQAREAIDYISGAAVHMKAKRETDYYDELTERTEQVVNLTSILVGIMAIGAVFAVANTMYAAVDGRRREIAMLRTIGFSRSAIIVSFIIESLLLCTLACGAGLFASLFVNGARKDFLSDATWTVMAYELRITPTVCIVSLVAAALVGLIGAIAPAIRASRVRIIEALRKA